MYMFDHGDRVASDFVHDVQTFVAGQAPATPAPDFTRLIEQARGLADDGRLEGWLEWGIGGQPLTGEDLAAHAEAAIEVLHRIGWNPSFVACRGISQAMMRAVREHEYGRFSEDTRHALGRVLEDLICAETGAPYADYGVWERHPQRLLDEVVALLTAAAAYARAYGAVSAPHRV
jgi:hypothetical protein